MGITIHWDLEFEGSDVDVCSLLMSARDCARAIAFKFVNNALFKVDYRHGEPERSDDDDYEWARIQARPYVGDSFEYSTKHWGFVMNCWAAEGCEPTNLSLVTEDGQHWTGRGFTKTQYADDFVSAHLMVCEFLRAVSKLSPKLKVEVHDEGDYYDTDSSRWQPERVERVDHEYVTSAQEDSGRRQCQGRWRFAVHRR